MDSIQMIRRELKRKHVTSRDLAKKLTIAPSAVHAMMSRSSLQVQKLYKVSQALEYNFFREIAAELNYKEPDYEQNIDAIQAPLLEQIKNLQLEVSILRQTLKDITAR